jgi:hypothetical protein
MTVRTVAVKGGGATLDDVTPDDVTPGDVVVAAGRFGAALGALPGAGAGAGDVTGASLVCGSLAPARTPACVPESQPASAMDRPTTSASAPTAGAGHRRGIRQA